MKKSITANFRGVEIKLFPTSTLNKWRSGRNYYKVADGKAEYICKIPESERPRSGGANRGQGRKGKGGGYHQFRASEDVEKILKTPEKYGHKDKTELIETAIRYYDGLF